MPGSTGPDINTYQIPEVGTNDTFAFWRDASNTANYKLNKLRIYDAVDTASIGVTYTSAGVWSATLVPTILSGHTFTSLVRFTSGLTASGIYASSGSTFGAGVWIGGGVTASALYVSTGSTFGAGVAVAGGVTVGAIYASSGSTFGGGVWITGGVTASAVYASTGSTFAGNLRVGSDAVGATLGVCGGIMLHSASPLRFGDVTSGRWVAFRGPNSVGTNFTWTLPSADGAGGQVLCTNGNCGLSWGNQAADVAAGNNTEIQYNASGGFSASSALTLTAGGLSASAVYASRGSTFAAGVAVAGGLTASAVYASRGSTFGGDLRVGSDAVGATLGVCGGIMLHSASSLRFGVTTSNRWVAFQAPNSVAANFTWTLPSVDGVAGSLLSTTNGILGWTAMGLSVPGVATQILTSDGVGGLSAAPCFTLLNSALMFSNPLSNVAIGASAMYGTISVCNIGIGGNALKEMRCATSACNIGIGYNALCRTQGYENTAIGVNAMSGATGCNNIAMGASAGACSSGDGNIAMGGNAGAYSKLFCHSTAIGSNALSYSCVYNSVAIGNDAGAYSCGFCNTAMGNRAMCGSTGCANAAMGNDAGAYSCGCNNTAMGNRAMYGTIASCNIAIGSDAMCGSTCGAAFGGKNNIAVGDNGLAESCLGDCSVAIGFNAMRGNNRSCFFTAIGASAGAYSRGSYNFAMGNDAGSYLCGSSNTAIGNRAMHCSGNTYSTAIGASAGAYSRGTYNFAMGNDAGTYSCGDYSIAMGNRAMYGATMGFQNTAIGFGSMCGMSGGNSNNAIGENAMCKAVKLCCSTAIGASAMANALCVLRGVAIGENAMANAFCGREIYAIGNGAMQFANQCCSSGIGENALQGATGYSNNSIGSNSMCGACGFYNTAIGENAMRGTSGDCNTAVGFNAMRNACAKGNTAVGASAGSSGGFYCNATAIGFNAQFYASDTVKLGNTASNVVITGSVVDNSDCRNKTDVRPTIWGLDFINALRPVDYRWDHRSDYADGTPDGSKKGTRFHSGLLAQEVQAAADVAGEDFAGVIHWSYNGISQGPEEFGLKYAYFVAPLIRAVQELSVRVCAEEFRRKE